MTLTRRKVAAVRRVLELLDSVLAAQKPEELTATIEGGLFTWGELRQHIHAALKLLAPPPPV